jgi:hypothetical protein
MRVNEINVIAAALYERMIHDGYSRSVLENAKWIIDHFEAYCRDNGYDEANMPLVAQFLREKYDIDCYAKPAIRMHSVLRRPLLILMEFYEGGAYCKTHQRGTTTAIPIEYEDFFLRYRDFVNGLDNSVKVKKRKLWVITNYLTYLVGKGVRRAHRSRGH